MTLPSAIALTVGDSELLALRASELSYRRLFESAQDGVLILDFATGRIRDVNPYLTQLLGFEHSEMVGRTVAELSPFKDIESNRAMLARLQERGHVRYDDLPLETRAGRRMEVEFVSNVYEAGTEQVIQCNIRDITDRKRSEESLMLLKTCVAQLQDMVLITAGDPLDEPGPKIVFVNPAFERITGYSAAEALGRSPRFLQGPKTDRGVLAEIHQALARHVPIRRQLLNYHKDGSEYWLDLDIVPIFSAAGGCTHFAAVERDITREKRIEELLLRKTALFDALVNSSTDGILVVDGQGRKIVQNQRMVELWGVPPEIAGDPDDRTLLAWVVGQTSQPEKFAEKVATLYAQPDAHSHDEIELGTGLVLDRDSAPILGKDGTSYGRIWTFRDITQRKRVEAQIAEQAAFLDKARDAITVRDLAGTIVYWNQGAERVYGWSRAEVIGRGIGALVFIDPHQFDEISVLAISSGEWSGELRHRTRDGREITVESRWTLMRDAEGQPKSLLAINTDVTERKKIEAHFMRAQRMESIGTLAGGIAHDLNNILAPIMMSIELLKAKVEQPKARSLLETIEVSARRGADIVRQVLSFARGVEGQRIEVPAPALFADLEKIIRGTFPKDIHVQFSQPTGAWAIRGDPTQLQQVLLNLCVNARDAMPLGGSLRIGIANCAADESFVRQQLGGRTGRFVNLSVSDSGSGIPAPLLDKIFEPFFTTKDIGQGTGLGLSTVMAIVKSHEGIIKVYSEPGHGTTFNLYLPASDAAATPPDATAVETLPRGRGETILIADDEAAILAVTGQTLVAFGYRVLTAGDGAAAVALYAQHPGEIALVLTDITMPLMDGPALIHALLRINPGVKIVAASGLNANAGRARLTGGRIRRFLTKPFSAESLLRTIRLTLDEA